MRSVLSVLTFTILSLSSLVAVAQVDDVGKDGLAQARKDSTQFLVDKKPPGTSQPVIEQGGYFVEQFKKDREVKGTKKIGPATVPFEGKVALADTDKKLIVCLEIANAMGNVAEEDGDHQSDMPAKWDEARKAVLEKLTTKNEKQKQAAMSDVERLAWEQFLEEWQKEALKAGENRFGDALIQAAYEIVKAGMDITTQQETVAQAAQAAASTGAGVVGTGAGAYARPGGYYHSDVIHERLMNGIYRRHHRRMNKITRIRARTGRY